MNDRGLWGIARKVGRVTGALVVLLCCATAVVSQQRLTDNVTTDPAKAELVFDDIERFVAAKRQIDAGENAAEVLQREYLDAASPGLGMFIEKYDLTVERLTEAMAKHPEKYAAIEANLEALREQAPAFREVYGEIAEIVPEAVFPPTYFVVAGHRGIGSGSTEGPLISIEKDTPESIRTNLAATLVHEMMHIEQLAVLDEAYFEIFSGPGRTLLATCLREGIATYFSRVITGGSRHKNAARDFLLANEEALWTRFEQEMLGTEMGDWLWSDPADPEQPRDVGYAMGARIAEHYYQGAQDKVQAMRDLLGVTDYPELLERSGYPGFDER